MSIKCELRVKLTSCKCAKLYTNVNILMDIFCCCALASVMLKTGKMLYT